MTVGRRRLMEFGAGAGAVVAALMLAAAPQASASAGSTVEGYNSGYPTYFSDLATCNNVFTGHVTADDSSGGIEASIDNFSVDCQADTSVTANALPWTLKLQEDRNYTIEGFDVNITTRQGTCRYIGTVQGGMQFPGGVYDLRGNLARQSAGCGGDEQITVQDTIEVISTNG
jgi:hypothetical protein